jgi:hypothetical protein
VSCEALAKDDISVQHEAEKGFSDPAASQAPEGGERGRRLSMPNLKKYDFWIEFGKEGRRTKGRRVSAVCTHYANPTDSPWRLILGSYALALLTIVQGMAALSHFLSLSLSYTTLPRLCNHV